MPEQSASDRKLAQYLNEAYGLQKRSESTLRAYAASASKPANKKRLKAHLLDTKRNAREIKQRIKQLGGVAQPRSESQDAAAEDAASATPKVALAAVPARASTAGGEEQQLRHALAQYVLESEQIALCIAIVSLAETLADKDTLRLARAIHRGQERMRSFLEKEIPRLVKALCKAELSSAPSGASPAPRPRRARTVKAATAGPALAAKTPVLSRSLTRGARRTTAGDSAAPSAPGEIAA